MTTTAKTYVVCGYDGFETEFIMSVHSDKEKAIEATKEYKEAGDMKYFDVLEYKVDVKFGSDNYTIVYQDPEYREREEVFDLKRFERMLFG